LLNNPRSGNAICLPENSPTNIAHKWRANDFDLGEVFDGLSWLLIFASWGSSADQKLFHF